MLAMSLHDTKNLVYFVNSTKKGDSKKEKSLSEEQLEKIFETLAKQAMKERTPDLGELESIIQDSMKSEQEQNQPTDSDEQDETDGSANFTKMLQDSGYLRDTKNWLTNKAFLEIGNKILHDVMDNLNSSDFGLHQTNYSGGGDITIDTTKKFEPGDDIKYLSASHTILNSIQRLVRNNSEIAFPLSVDPNDLEEYETLEDVRAAVVYCIDLSSTMKIKMGNISRIESAKRALWSLYMLNKKFFPNDSVYVIGFASLASQVNSYDIPFLKTFDSNDNFLHYTNYQAALKLSRKILNKSTAQNKRIVLITDGQPSACFVENEYQKNEIISEKPYSNFYTPEKTILSSMRQKKNLNLDANIGKLVYLCFRYKKVDKKIEKRTIVEAKKCLKAGIEIDSIVVSDEKELLEYVKQLEKELKGKTYHIDKANMDRVLVTDYLSNARKVFTKKQRW